MVGDARAAHDLITRQLYGRKETSEHLYIDEFLTRYAISCGCGGCVRRWVSAADRGDEAAVCYEGDRVLGGGWIC